MGHVEFIKKLAGQGHRAAPENGRPLRPALGRDRGVDDARELIRQGGALRNEPAVGRGEFVGGAIDRSDESGEPVGSTENVRVGKGDDGITRSKIRESGALIVDFLSFRLGDASTNEGDRAEAARRVGMGPDRMAGAEFEMLAEPPRDGVVPALEADDDAVILVGLPKDGVEKAGGRLRVESLHWHNESDRLLRADAVLPTTILGTPGH